MEEEKKIRNKSLIIGGQKYYTQFTNKYENKKPWEPINPKLIKAIIPSSIEEIIAKENKQYKKGEVLLIFKAMKMSNKLLMPFSGIIKKIHVKEGDSVPKNQLLIEIL